MLGVSPASPILQEIVSESLTRILLVLLLILVKVPNPALTRSFPVFLPFLLFLGFLRGIVHALMYGALYLFLVPEANSLMS